MTYCVSPTWVVQTKRVSLEAMDAVCQGFRKLVACAYVYSHPSTTAHRNTAERIHQWVRSLKGANPQGYLLERDSVRAWKEASILVQKFTVGMTTKDHNGYTKEVAPFCSVYWSARSAREIDHRALDANCPGFSEWCEIMCVGHGMAGVDVFRLLSTIPQSLSYDVVRTNVKLLSDSLRACLSMEVPADQIIADFVKSARLGGDSQEALPELGVTCP